MFKKIKKWIRNKIIAIAVKSVRGILINFYKENPEFKEFHDGLYNKSIAEFIKDCTVTLGEKNDVDTNKLTFVEYLKRLLKPLDDKFETIIVKVIDGLK